MGIYAHSVGGQGEQAWEPLAGHLTDVGMLAAEFAEPFGAATLGRAMGLLHDIGKTSQAYQAYIRRPRDQGGPKGPDHSSAGAREALGAYGPLGRLLAFGIAGHHAGLMDGAGHEGGTLDARLKSRIENYDGWQAHVADLPSAAEIAAGMPAFTKNAIEPMFSGSFLIRMLFSSLVDADFLQTEAFYARSRGEAPPQRGGVLRAEC